MTNRVDDLESEIAELRAAVNGLTEELVETKARVRELETEAEADADSEERAEDGFVDAEPVEATQTTTKSDDHVEVVEHEAASDAEPGASAFEEDKSTEDQESTEEDATESGDIIVA